MVFQKEMIVFQPSIFRCENVSFREGITEKGEKITTGSQDTTDMIDMTYSFSHNHGSGKRLYLKG